MVRCHIRFFNSANKEGVKVSQTLKEQLKKKFGTSLSNPRTPKSILSVLKNCKFSYKV